MSFVWCDIDQRALCDNARLFRRLVGDHVILAMTVKANGYGHGLLESAAAFLEGGADWLSVHSIEDAEALRAAGIEVPIYIMGPIELAALARADGLDLRMVVYNEETVERLIELEVDARLHIKIETGNHRQGISADEALRLAVRISSGHAGLKLEGICSHFANIEDTTDHRYARKQLSIFQDAVERLASNGHRIPIRHLSNSAATLLWPDQQLDLVRVGISGYGLWPSKETQIAASLAGRGDLSLTPAMHWKTRIAQIKIVPAGEFIGYGCTFMTSHISKIAILPVGYHDGLDRGLSNLGHVLCRGQRAPIRGRVCMNMTMVDVTDIAEVALEDEVVLLGQQGDEVITAEQHASWSGSINYEVVSRIASHLPRRPFLGGKKENAAAPYRPPQGGELKV
ncbi:MAG: alanine racemase [Bradymonadia bacterium]